jgi:hypothetical protein
MRWTKLGTEIVKMMRKIKFLALPTFISLFSDYTSLVLHCDKLFCSSEVGASLRARTQPCDVRGMPSSWHPWPNPSFSPFLLPNPFFTFIVSKKKKKTSRDSFIQPCHTSARNRQSIRLTRVFFPVQVAWLRLRFGFEDNFFQSRTTTFEERMRCEVLLKMHLSIVHWPFSFSSTQSCDVIFVLLLWKTRFTGLRDEWPVVQWSETELLPRKSKDQVFTRRPSVLHKKLSKKKWSPTRCLLPERPRHGCPRPGQCRVRRRGYHG